MPVAGPASTMPSAHPALTSIASGPETREDASRFRIVLLLFVFKQLLYVYLSLIEMLPKPTLPHHRYSNVA
jgi:hypothetical protein